MTQSEPTRQRTHAKSLRRTMTDAERTLWRRLRSRGLLNAKFRRQQVVGPYIVDFVDFDAQLVIEVDGGQHTTSTTDEVRTEWLQAQGFTVLRFWNHEVLQQTEAVLMRIARELEGGELGA